MNTTQQFSPKEIAKAIAVSEATIKRWVDKGKIPAEKTLGGHRKIGLHDLKQFCENSKYSIKHPEILGITPSTGRAKDKMRIAQEELNEAFNTCNEEQIRGLLTNLLLADVPYQDIFDQVLAPALHQLGCDWENGEIDAFQERRTIQICTRLLYSFENFLPTPESDAPIALLGTLKNDPYIIPTLMLETILRSRGWRTELLGNDLEIKSYQKALTLYKASLLVISCSGNSTEEELLSNLKILSKSSQASSAQLVAGGSHITGHIVDSLPEVEFPYSMTGFYEFIAKI